MASIASSNCIQIHLLRRNPTSISSPTSVRLSFRPLRLRRCCLAVDGQDSTYGAELLRKPVLAPPVVEEEKHNRGAEEPWVYWENKILEDTVPLVGLVKSILHSGNYEEGDRLSPEHERIIMERLLPYHPECKTKIGAGVDYITIGHHPYYESRCLFIVREDGERVDFSFWKCVKGLIWEKYPQYADRFILRHFNWQNRC